MENLTLSLLIGLTLIVGVFAGFYLDVEEVCEDCEVCEPCMTPVCEVTECDVCEEPIDYLSMAMDDFLDEIDDNDDLECGKHSYDMDEVSVSKVYWHSVLFDDEDTQVDFKVKLKFDEDDERSCRETYEVSVMYEEGEKPDVDY